MKNLISVQPAILAFFILCMPTFVLAQDEAKNDAAELAKKLANPVASLISVPIQNNTDFGIGDNFGTRNTLNIQPVIPFSLTENVNLITRVIVPIVSQYNISGIAKSENGLGDVSMSAFFSPTSSKVTWGVGPILLLPTGADAFSAKKFGIGPTAVALYQTNGITIGGLVNQGWSVAGNEDTGDLSTFFSNPLCLITGKPELELVLILNSHKTGKPKQPAFG